MDDRPYRHPIGLVLPPEEEKPNDELDGCAIDFKKYAIGDDEADSMLTPEGEEEDEVDEDGDPLTPGSPDLGLATRLRRVAFLLGADGEPMFKVREVPGWKRRGRDFAGVSIAFNGRGSVNHHTAGAAPSAGNAPSLGIIVKGRSDLPGPLASTLQAYNDTAIVIAAGVANHAGSGSWRGLVGNSSVYGLEVEHPGTRRVARRRVAVMVAIHTAFLWRPKGPDIDPRFSCQHREWSTAGKVDFATNFVTKAQQDEFRKMIRECLAKVDQEHRRRKRRR